LRQPVAYRRSVIAAWLAPCSNLRVSRSQSANQAPSTRLATARRKSLALDLLGQGHTLAHVRKVLGINRVTMYPWRQDDPSFARAYSDGMESGADAIEQEARRRAVEGYDRPVFRGGKNGRRSAFVFGSVGGSAAPGPPTGGFSRDGKPDCVNDVDHDTWRTARRRR
jgi:hypothetical protein